MYITQNRGEFIDIKMLRILQYCKNFSQFKTRTRQDVTSGLQNFSLSSWKFEFAPQIQYYADSKKFFGINGAAGMLPFESRNPREGIECDRKVKSSGLLISRREAFGSRTVLEGNSIVEFPRGNSLSREWRGKAESGGRRSVGEGWEVGGSEEAASHPWRIARIIVSGSLYRSMVIDQWIQAIKIQANL